MRYVKALAFYALLFFVQPVLAAIIPVLQVPNLVVCVTLMYMLLKNEEDYTPVIVAGAVFSMLSDICYGQYAGAGTLAFLAIVVSVFALKHYINNENRLMVVLTICGASLLYSLVYWAVTALLGSPYGVIYLIKHALIYMVGDLAVCLCIYFASIGKIIQDRRDRYFR